MTALLEQAIAKVYELPDEQQDAIAQLLLQAAEQYNRPVSRPNRKAGSAEGRIWIADDFDTPLEDFKDYM